MKRASQRFSHGSSLAELNITPLLDLVFVLLIIFMITTPVLEQQMDVNLPNGKAEKIPTELDPKNLNALNVDGNGKILLNKQVVPIASLESELTAILAKNPDATVSLRADKKLPYQQIFAVLEALKGAGMKFGLANSPEEK